MVFSLIKLFYYVLLEVRYLFFVSILLFIIVKMAPMDVIAIILYIKVPVVNADSINTGMTLLHPLAAIFC